MALISRRRLLAAAPAAMPARRKRKKANWPVGMQPDPGNLFFAVFIAGGPGSGLFVYNGPPGTGTLADSISAAPGGTDQFGNVYLDDFAAYGPGPAGTVIAANLTEGTLQFLAAATEAGPWATGATVTFTPGLTGGGFLSLLGPHGQVSYVFPSGDPAGVTDFNVISQALLAGAVRLVSGTYFIASKITVTGTSLTGTGQDCIVQPGGGYAGVLLAAGSNSTISDLFVQNGGSDAITVAGGISEWQLRNLRFSGNAGLCVNATVTGPAHGEIHHIRGDGGGSANGGGIFINGGTGGAITTEINVSDIDIQGCLTAPVYHLACVTDVNCAGPFNGSVAAASGANAILVEGACQNCDLGPIDVGGCATAAALLIQKGVGVNSPTQIHAGPGVVQSGLIGIQVTDSAARLDFDRLWSTHNRGDGWQFTGSGAFIVVDKCGGNTNNQAAGTAYDIDITSTAHVYIDAFRGVSGAVTQTRNITLAGNHVTVVGDPAGTTTAGFAPAGW